LDASREKCAGNKKVTADRERLEVKLRVMGKTRAGRLPDFLIIGTQKGGTTFLYGILRRHPHFQAAVKKEIHFFDTPKFNKGVDWYRTQFPPPQYENGQKVITGESSPYYMFHPHTARRAAEVVPQARLIALLRDPVERAYSDYQHKVRQETETLSFEEAIEAEEERLRGEKEKMLADEHYRSLNHRRHSYLSRGIYVDQLIEWHRHFDPAQLLILRSEDLFARPQETVKSVLKFLRLPERDLELTAGRNTGGYKESMAPAIRRQLQEYFEPHNQRLYDYLGRDFRW
jgi:hypothetical protein